MHLIRKHPIFSSIVALTLLVAFALALVRWARPEREVRVQAGTRTVCTYGELLSSTVKTIWVRESEAGKYRVTTRRTLCDKHRNAQKYYELGQALAKQGRYPAALKAFKTASTYDPKFKDVSAWVASGGHSGGTSTGGGSSTSAGGGTTSLSALLPASIPGYTPGQPAKQRDYVERAYVPADQRAVSTLIIRIYDRGTAAKAAQFINRVSRRVYSGNRRTIDVRPGVKAYFGTQGTVYAYCAWARGRIVRELLMSSSTGRPAELRDRIRRAAQRVR